MKYSFLTLFAYLISYTVADVSHPILWERSFNMNISNPTSNGKVNQATSYMVTSQDFQGVILDDSFDDPPERIMLNFGESCLSSNTTLQTLQALNANTIESKLLAYAQKLALVKRGNCTWSEKVSVVNNLALLNNINITAIYIYDNQSYGDAIIITKTSTNGSGSLDVPEYTTPLPASRSVLNMSDNDLLSLNTTSKTVYFIPNVYGETFVTRINAMTDPTDSSVKTFWLLTAYLSAVSWGDNSGSTGFFFSFNASYIAYIVSFAGVLIIMIIVFRWWTSRQARSDATAAAANQNVQLRATSSKVDPLPVELVNKLPVDTYTPELIKNENCAICLEDFKPGKDDVRLLPCGHGFCVLCIDPWLTQKSCLCPMCKWDCLPVDLRKERELKRRRNNQFEQLETEENHNDSEPGPSSPRDSQIEMNETEEAPEAPAEKRNNTANEESSNSSDIAITIPDQEEISHNRASSSSALEQNHTVIDLQSVDKKQNNEQDKQ